MKRIFIVIFLLIFFGIEARADSFMFIWDEGTTFVTVPLNANINDYINNPKAKLYRNGQLLTDAVMHYNYNGDWLYLLTDVDTSKVGDYKVWYKISESKYKPGQCQGYKTLVTFHIVDDVAPIITDYLEVIDYVVGTDRPSYLDYISAYDNSGNCQVSILDDNVDYTKIGKYIARIKAYDGYSSTYKEFIVNVIDRLGPIVTFLGENKTIVMSLGDTLDMKSYFKAHDDVDGDVLDSISYGDIDISKVGSFPLVVSFCDKQGNVTSYSVIVKIVDDSIPEIILVEDSIILDYKTDFSTYDFKANISSAYDGKNNIISDIEIDSSSLENRVGVYSIFYKYIDNGEVYNLECNVHLLANEAPIIDTQDITLEQGMFINYLDYINVIDPSDGNVSESIQIDDSRVDYQNPGIYPVYIVATNSSGLMSDSILYVTIVEDTKELDWKIIVIFVMGIYFVSEKVINKVKKKRNA